MVPFAGRTVDESRIYLGCLYLAFERGALSMERLLHEAGDFTDPPSDDVPGCETFYLLLNEIDGGAPPARAGARWTTACASSSRRWRGGPARRWRNSRGRWALSPGCNKPGDCNSPVWGGARRPRRRASDLFWDGC